VITDPARTALLVLDMQNELVEPGGTRYAQFEPALAERRTLVHAGQAIAAARRHGVEVVYVTVGWRAGYPEHAPTPQMEAARKFGGMEDDTWGTTVSDRIAPATGEVVLRKRCVSALNATELARYLTVKGKTTLVLIGIATNWAVEGTARDAADLGYRVIVLEDCCAGFTDEMHEFSVTKILPLLGTVSDSASFESALEELSPTAGGR
jgi:nicotinamidase-related amidase